MLNELLMKYCEMFDENFPIMSMVEKDEEEIIDLIKTCIDTETKYNAIYKKDCDY